jgi:hypothetical protein
VGHRRRDQRLRYRLYSVLLRYGQSSGQRMPGRATLARRLHKSKDTVDRALRELVGIGAVVIEHRRHGRQNLTNRYHLMNTPPGARRGTVADTPGRTDAATPGRTDAATLAAKMRPNPVVPTQTTPPPSPPSDGSPNRHGGTAPSTDGAELAALLSACGIADLDALAAACRQLRHRVGCSPARWSAPQLAEVLHEAVVVRGWPGRTAGSALLALAADPATRGPMRLACPGPWWDQARAAPGHGRSERDAEQERELQGLEARLAEADGRRVWAQQRARDDLGERGLPVTRLTVARRACELLDEAEYAPC